MVSGDAGAGKSSLINQLLGEDKAPAGKNLNGVTKTIGTYAGKLKSKDILLYDMPGFGDQDVKTDALLKMWLSDFSSKSFDYLLICISINNSRLSSNSKAALSILLNLVNNIKPESIHVVLTHCDIQDQKKMVEYEDQAKQWIKHLNEINITSNKTKFQNSVLTSKLFKFGIEKLESVLTKKALECFQFRNEKQDKLISESIDIINKTTGTNISSKKVTNNILSGNSLVSINFNCYHPLSKLVKKDGNSFQEIMIKNLSLNDEIKTINGCFEKVFTFTKYNVQNRKMIAISLKHKNTEKKLELTPEHHVLRIRKKLYEKVPSRMIVKGDTIKGENDEEYEVILIEEYHYSGELYNARTKSLTMLVNGLKCSCSDENDGGNLGHQALIICYKIHEKLPDLIVRAGRSFMKASQTNKKP